MDVRRRMRDAVRGIRGRQRPRLSVIVPVYNVEHYLAECLDSILAQTFRDFEVVVVDDGSTDSSSCITADYALRYSEVRVITAENRGLGAARNRGVKEAAGALLTFVDSDDTIPPEAYEVMLRALDESGSDFVVGSLKRYRPDGEYFHPPWLRRLHRERRLSLTAEEFPDILADVFACNKIFRRDFWERRGLAFPEGVRYEDQVLTTEAYLTARSFDVIRMPVYFWRVRDDGTSITQRRHEIEDLRDRIATKRTALRIVEDMGVPEVSRVFHNFVLSMDLPNYFQELPGCSDEYWEILHRGITELWSTAPPFSDAAMPVHYRLVGWLVMNGRREQAEAVSEAAERFRPDIPLVLRGNRVLADLPYLDDEAAAVPNELYQLRTGEIPWDAELQCLWVEDQTITIAGKVTIRRVAIVPPVQVTVSLCAQSGTEIPLSVESPREAGGQFVAHLDLERLAQTSACTGGVQARWTVEIRSWIAGVGRAGGFTRTASELALVPAVESTPIELDVAFNPAEGLCLIWRSPAEGGGSDTCQFYEPGGP